MAKFLDYWKNLPREWQFAISAFVSVRIFLWVWSLAVYFLMPVAVSNIYLYDEPIVTVFDLKTSRGYSFSRQVKNELLLFRAVNSEYIADIQTGSVWSLEDGNAVAGIHVGDVLNSSSYDIEEIFPYKGVLPTQNILLGLWQRFDANWYLKVAERGYDGSDSSTVYFPLYPFFIHILSYLISTIFAATVISNLALFGSLILMYRLFLKFADESTVRRSLVYILIFPSAFFLTAAYTEALFLFFTLLSFDFASRREWGWAAIWGTFASLTRLQGVLLFIPLAYMLWRDYRDYPLRTMLLRAMPLSLIPLSSLCFELYSNFTFLSIYGDTWLARFVFPGETIWVAISLVFSGDGSFVDVLNLLTTLGVIVSIFFIWKKFPFEYTLYSMLMLIAPIVRLTDVQPLVSMIRYTLLVFPLFLMLGSWGKNPWVNRAIIYPSILLQLFLSAQFILWGWVA